MGDFAYNNTKNTSTGHTPFYLNCGFYPRVSFEDNVDPRFRSCFADKLAKELRELMDICQQNLLHTQKLQKKAHDKGVKPQSYAPREKVWLNSKYIKIKQNQKLESKFFGLFWNLHPVGKQVYKLDLPTKWRIHDVFYVSLLEQNTTRKGRINELFSEPETEFDAGDNKEYKVEAIKDSAVYAKKAEGYFTRPILFGFLERLPRGRKHLGAMLCSHAPSENDLHFLQKLPGEANSDLLFPWFRSAHGQAISQAASQALYKAKARPSNRLNKMSQGMRYWTMRFFLPYSS